MGSGSDTHVCRRESQESSRSARGVQPSLDVNRRQLMCMSMRSWAAVVCLIMSLRLAPTHAAVCSGTFSFETATAAYGCPQGFQDYDLCAGNSCESATTCTAPGGTCNSCTCHSQTSWPFAATAPTCAAWAKPQIRCEQQTHGQEIPGARAARLAIATVDTAFDRAGSRLLTAPTTASATDGRSR